jgi:hypothetical protein
MGGEQSKPKGPDFTQGVALDDIPDGSLIGGHVRAAKPTVNEILIGY